MSDRDRVEGRFEDDGCLDELGLMDDGLISKGLDGIEDGRGDREMKEASDRVDDDDRADGDGDDELFLLFLLRLLLLPRLLILVPILF